MGRLADYSAEAARAVVTLLADAEAAGRAPDLFVLRAAADAAGDLAQTVFKALQQAGAVIPDLPAPPPIPLHLLDTPDTRRLLALLTEAQAVAERVDAVRGRTLPADVPLGAGQSRGTDLAESISELARRLRVEVEGPAGME